MDCSLPGSSVHRITQARIREWVAIFFSRGSVWPRSLTCFCFIVGGFFFFLKPLSHLGSPIEFTFPVENIQKLEVSKNFTKNTLLDSWKCSYTTSHLPRWHSGKESFCQYRRQETWVQFLGWEDILERKWQHTLVFLPGKSHGKRSLAGYSLWDHRSFGHT